MTKREDEDARAVAELRDRADWTNLDGDATNNTPRSIDEAALDMMTEDPARPRIKKYICGSCYTVIEGEPYFGDNNRARHPTCASGLVSLPWQGGAGVDCPGCGEEIIDRQIVVILNHDDRAKDGAWHQPCADKECKPLEAPKVKPGRLGGPLSKRLADEKPPKFEDTKHNIARHTVEAVLEETDVDFAIVVTFKKHGKDGVAFRIASAAGLQCDPVQRELFAHVAEATSMGIGSFLKSATGHNTVILDRTDAPDVPDEEPTS